MVGFGKSLRMARRPGWEGGYLDYETLKLLLSQIEAVYEEEAQRAGLPQPQPQPPHEHYPASHGRRRRMPGALPGRDFRRDLFLATDSDAAYGSVHEQDDDRSVRSAEDALLAMETAAAAAAAPKSFSLSYSHERHSSEDDDEEDDTAAAGCGSGMFGWRGSGSRGNQSTNRAGRHTDSLNQQASRERIASKPHHHHHALLEDEEDNFAYVHHEQQTSFLLTSEAGEETVISPDMTHFSENPTEKSSLLPPATPIPHGSSLYTLSQDLTPPASRVRPTARPQTVLQQADRFATHGARPGPLTLLSFQRGFTMRNRAQYSQKLEQERQRARLRRRERKRRLRRLREARERKVPMYVRIAHSKARGIAERFLGLLRAETEKVLLFTQSRLGELADTAGSLRFPSFDDDNAHGRRKVEIQGALGQYDYPLADGGMHPSASSSSDDEQARNLSGMFLWTDTEDDNEPRVAPSAVMSSRTNETESLISSFRTPRVGGSKKSTVTTAGMVHRKLAHFRELRNSRPVFQRNDNILGEDMLFLSAVEEADGYTAVATELLHVLRFICVNLIAVRKICRKHDRLLMNRMLGGYYNRSKSFKNGHLGDFRTLGGLLVQASNDVFETHPALIGQMNRFKLVGIYDRKIQKLANSRTVQVISSCLALALSEYEVARNRADNLTKLNASTVITPQFLRRGRSNDGIKNQNAFDSDDETGGPPSTASTISLTRLQFAVASIFSLREAARYKAKDYEIYLSRGSFVCTGQQVAGEGLDGCSRRTLDFIVSFEPDSVLLHDPSILFQGLQNGKWHRSLSKLMNSTLAASIIPEHSVFTYRPGLSISKEELIVYNSLTMSPQNRKTRNRNDFHRDEASASTFVSALPDVTASELQLNCISGFLFAANYYVAHPTSTSFVKTIEIASANSALIIGAPNISAFCCAAGHCWFISRQISDNRYPIGSIHSMRALLAVSALAGCSGNIIQTFAASRDSVFLEIMGRIAIGFSFTEILNRHILSFCLPCFLVMESSRFLKYQIAGMIFGISVATVAEAILCVMKGAGVNSTALLSWTFSFLWLIHLIRICMHFDGRSSHQAVDDEPKTSKIVKVEARDARHQESDVESSANSDEGSASILQQSSSDESSGDEMNPIKAAYGSSESGTVQDFDDEREGVAGYNDKNSALQQNHLLVLKDSLLKVKSLVAFHFGIPICLLNIAYTMFCWEIIFSATPIIVSRYFEWDMTRGGIYLCWLTIIVFPAHYISCQIAQRSEERTVMKRSLFLIVASYLGMVNWLSLYALASRVPFLLDDIDGNEQKPEYDWRLGLFQFGIGASLAFTGLVSLTGSSVSLLAKISPHCQRVAIANIGTVVTFVTLVARFLADGQIALIDLSHKLINTDLVNSLTFPMLFFSLVLLYLVKKHFFYLM